MITPEMLLKANCERRDAKLAAMIEEERKKKEEERKKREEEAALLPILVKELEIQIDKDALAGTSTYVKWVMSDLFMFQLVSQIREKYQSNGFIVMVSKECSDPDDNHKLGFNISICLHGWGA